MRGEWKQNGIEDSKQALLQPMKMMKLRLVHINVLYNRFANHKLPDKFVEMCALIDSMLYFSLVISLVPAILIEPRSAGIY